MNEIEARHRFISEALTWVGTPFVWGASVKGRSGGVDCAAMIHECGIAAGLVPPLERPRIPAGWIASRGPEHFIEFIHGTLGRLEIERPEVGDVHVYWIGRHFAHGAIRISETEIVHAYQQAGCVLISHIDEPALTHIALADRAAPRPVRYFSSVTQS